MKYNTCFFERYASLVIREFLGERYANLENIDRPDLQDNTLGIGIEVTRAIQENKNFANSLINEMAADEILKVDKSLLSDIQRFGYAYGFRAWGRDSVFGANRSLSKSSLCTGVFGWTYGNRFSCDY